MAHLPVWESCWPLTCVGSRLQAPESGKLEWPLCYSSLQAFKTCSLHLQTAQALTEWSVGMQGFACRVSSHASTAARPAIKP